MYRTWYEKINWILIAAVLLLVVFGMLMIYSATFRDVGFGDVKRQIMAFAAGLVLSALVIFLDYRRICRESLYIGKVPVRISYIFYGLIVFLLVFVLKKGHTALGSQRWIGLGPLGTFEPSEFAKLAVILALASFLSDREEPSSWKSFLIGGAMAGLPLLLVLVQPDLGTSIVIASIFLFLMFFVGANPAWLMGMVVAAVGVLFKIMKPYQRERLLVFLHPNKDPKGGGWNLIQSLIAVGSGKVTGKGLFAGTQTQLKFVPEHSTDFIFTVVAEELGFIGALFMLILYLFVLWYATKIALETEDPLGRLLAAGITVMFFFHIFINVGMCMGVMPITGIPLPFISSGGSSLITGMVSIALLLNIEYGRDRLIP